MTNIKRLRKYLGLTQAEFANSLHVSRTTVTMWETEQREPDYALLCKISTKYSVSTDYIIGAGIFSDWDSILEKKEEIYSALQQLIPADYMATGSDEFLISQLYIALFIEKDEIWLARWFAYAIKSVSFSEEDDFPTIVFTTEFQATINAHRRLSRIQSKNRIQTAEELMKDFMERMRAGDSYENDLLMKYEPTGLVPVLGKIPAGNPLFASEEIDGYESVTVPNPENCYYLRVEGDSMIGAGIQSGDLVLIRQQPTADSGQIVACKVNGNEATLKRFRQQDETVLLMPENPNYEPIVVPAKDFETGYAQIFGVAIEVKRKL